MKTAEEINKRRNELFGIIRRANNELEKLREECSHKNTFKGLWEWAPGHIYNALICQDCGKCIRNLDIADYENNP